MKQSGKNYKKIVIKIGSSIFYDGKELDLQRLCEIVSDIAGLIKLEGKEVVIVSSGAIALGMNSLGLSNRPKELSGLQAAAAIGQNALMDNYGKYFKKFRITCAQVLLTWDDFDSRKRYLNAKNTLNTLLGLKSVPVINENDTVSTDEIKFGDNDRLSALVAAMINADLLIILSDVDGLIGAGKNIIREVCKIDSRIKALACPSDKKSCVGGMVTKIEAAKITTDSGIPCVIANGRSKNIIGRIVKNPEAMDTWTLFRPKPGCFAAKQRWIAFGAKPKGAIIVDEGAKKAILSKKSLLCVGVVGTQGDFERADIVSVMDKQGNEFGRARAGLSSRQLDKVKGGRFAKEAAHCDNIVIL